MNYADPELRKSYVDHAILGSLLLHIVTSTLCVLCDTHVSQQRKMQGLYIADCILSLPPYGFKREASLPSRHNMLRVVFFFEVACSD